MFTHLWIVVDVLAGVLLIQVMGLESDRVLETESDQCQKDRPY